MTPPTRTGFGTRLIERGLAADLNGKVEMTYPLDGVVCTIVARLDGPEEPEEPEPDASRRRRRPRLPADPLASLHPPA